MLGCPTCPRRGLNPQGEIARHPIPNRERFPISPRGHAVQPKRKLWVSGVGFLPVTGEGPPPTHFHFCLAPPELPAHWHSHAGLPDRAAQARLKRKRGVERRVVALTSPLAVPVCRRVEGKRTPTGATPLRRAHACPRTRLFRKPRTTKHALSRASVAGANPSARLLSSAYGLPATYRNRRDSVKRINFRSHTEGAWRIGSRSSAVPRGSSSRSRGRGPRLSSMPWGSGRRTGCRSARPRSVHREPGGRRARSGGSPSSLMERMELVRLGALCVKHILPDARGSGSRAVQTS